MRQREWKKLKALVATLTFAQRQALKGELVGEDAAAASVEVIESQGKSPRCPHCGNCGKVRTAVPTPCSVTSVDLAGEPLIL